MEHPTTQIVTHSQMVFIFIFQKHVYRTGDATDGEGELHSERNKLPRDPGEQVMVIMMMLLRNHAGEENVFETLKQARELPEHCGKDLHDGAKR